MKQIWVVGSLNIDLVVTCDRFPLPGETLQGTSYRELLGGKGGNQAMALAHLGASPRLVAAVGGDLLGQRYRDDLAAAGVDVSFVSVQSDSRTGVALIEVAQGENRIVVVPGANATVTAPSVERALAQVQPGDVVLFQFEIPLEAVWAGIKCARSRGALVVVDPAPAVQLDAAILEAIDVLTPNESEAQVAAGTPAALARPDGFAAQRLVERGCRLVVQKCGARGALVVTEGYCRPVPAFAVSVVDTIGAGDSFNAGLALALAEGRSELEAVRWGNAAGALATRGRGAQGSLATRTELEVMLESNDEAEDPIRR